MAVAGVCPADQCTECAAGCPNWFKGNKFCDAACNNAACNFDNGDCTAGMSTAVAPAPATTSATTCPRRASDNKPQTYLNSTCYACEDLPQVTQLSGGMTCAQLRGMVPGGCTFQLAMAGRPLPPELPADVALAQVCPGSCGTQAATAG